ncbi:zinc-ribbon and DUF3426 domain-containing protein [Caballeronia sp. Lep1P3]|uniref:zinc-ribbon and DUF3426 domain-containing protein n=1 Tax=Caballeronia sp. Lep1P3 TaxID=2878150 RepID=UPI001FD51ECE|nr:zinc-ribbon and DUF3426 domain-containing protein [Caballeronia sp. Lep1P3]
MALATRCPHCETVFKLDPHLLAPHDGRVRCGHCQEVFDAAHHQFELPDDATAPFEAQHAAIIDDEVAVGPSTFSSSNKEATSLPPTLAVPRPLNLGKKAAPPPPPPPPPPPLPPSPLPPPDDDRTVSATAPAASAKDAANEPEAEPADFRHAPPLLRPEASPGERAGPAPVTPEAPPRAERIAPTTRFVDPVDDRAEPFIGPTRGHADFASADPTRTPAPASTSGPAAARRDADEPGFGARPSAPGAAHAPSANEAFPVRREPRSAMPPLESSFDGLLERPRKGLRAAGIVVAVLLALLLLVQLAWWQRETVMVNVPGSHASYVDICDELNCTISPPRYIAGLQIESSGLRQVDGPHKLELKLMLRNRADVPLAYPALELTLLDDNNDVAIRRVLWPQEYARPGTIFAIGLPPQNAQPVVVRLDTGDAVAANYRVQVFYP